jgi:hypothetical protein
MSYSLLVCLFAALLAVPVRGLAQVRPDYRALQEHLLLVVPMIGAGTHSDPKRPLYAPLPGAKAPANTEINAFRYQLSDDGKFAVVDFEARDRKAFQAIFKEARSDVMVFERGKADKATTEAAIQRYIKNFDLDKFASRRLP